MFVWAVFLSTTLIVVSGQDVREDTKPQSLPPRKDKFDSDPKSGYKTAQSLQMGAGTYHYYDTKGVLHIANYVNDMYGFRILNEYTPFSPLSMFSEAEKPKRPTKVKPRNKFNIDTFALFDEIEEDAPEPKKQNSEVKKRNETDELIQTEEHQSESSTISETVQKEGFAGRMPSGTFKWPSYPSVMDMRGPKAMDSKYFYGPRIFQENIPFQASFENNGNENIDAKSTPEPPKETTDAPSTTTAKAEESPVQDTPTISSNSRPFTGYYSINHSPSWARTPALPAFSTTGYSIRYGTRNVQPFAPKLSGLNKMWPEYPQLGHSATFVRNVQWGSI